MSQDVSQLCHKICRENVVRADGFTNYAVELGSIPKVTLDKAGPIWGLFQNHIQIIIYYQSIT